MVFRIFELEYFAAAAWNLAKKASEKHDYVSCTQLFKCSAGFYGLNPRSGVAELKSQKVGMSFTCPVISYMPCIPEDFFRQEKAVKGAMGMPSVYGRVEPTHNGINAYKMLLLWSQIAFLMAAASAIESSKRSDGANRERDLQIARACLLECRQLSKALVGRLEPQLTGDKSDVFLVMKVSREVLFFGAVISSARCYILSHLHRRTSQVTSELVICVFSRLKGAISAGV